jgi:hypothetical protein
VEKRFKPGQSGNPRGRQPGSKNKPKPPLIDDRFGTIVLQEYYREVTVPVQGEMLTLPIAQLAMRAIMARAAKGHVAAMRLATDLASRIEAQRAQDELERFQQLVLLKQDLTAELERRKHVDCTGLPPVLPHPDDIYIDLHRSGPRSGAVDGGGQDRHGPGDLLADLHGRGACPAPRLSRAETDPGTPRAEGTIKMIEAGLKRPARRCRAGSGAVKPKEDK